MSLVRPFVHLHCHTQFSLLDGANRISDLIGKVKECGMNSVAITDHGNLYGAFEFYNACRESDVNPIVGYEAYVAPGRRTDKSGATRVKEASFHLTLLAMNRTGYFNLIKLASKAFLEGFYYRPRIDKELLEQFSDGLICLSGCAASELSNLILQEKMADAERLAAWYHKVFGDRFYFEIQDCGLEIQRLCAAGTIDLANRMGVPLVATNDAHYLNQEDAAAHDILLCVSTQSVRSDEKRMRMEGNQFFVRSPDQMYAAFPGHTDAVARTQEIADRVDIQLDLSVRHYPVFAAPGNLSAQDFLRKLCEERLPVRYGDAVSDVHRQRLEYELGVIEQMGYSSYFLIVWDFVRFAEENHIPCGARGSACGSLVAYLLGLSNVCPLKFDLLFERFLDPSRTEPPDIDIDFCRDGRQRVIDYTKQKYGEHNVAQIGTFGSLKARAAIRDVGRALGIPLTRVDEIAKMVPETLGITLKDAMHENPDLHAAYEQDPQIGELIDIAMKLEGLSRSAGTHAAGVVVGDQPLDNYLPLQTITGRSTKIADGAMDIVTQWDGPHVEMAGLLKMDFLGLRNLTILDKAVQNVKKHRGLDIKPSELPLDDAATYALLQRGETKGIFQFESGGIRDLLTKMRPDNFNDIIATSALYRPGPLEGGMVMDYVEVKHGRKEITRIHPLVDEVLSETYGVMVFQEQVMRILNRVGGIDLSAAYRCIKAISKKKLKIIAKFREEFVAGGVERGLDEQTCERLFELIGKFAGYGFNRSHSAAYGAISYQTAYLKAHFPQEFMAALLSCGMESSERIMEHVDDARRMGIEVVPPSINRSDVEFSVAGGAVTFGLGAIKGVGENVVTAIVKEREAHGPFKSIFDLTERVDSKILGKGNLETLIKAGALDCLGPNRAQHLLAVERSIHAAVRRQQDKLSGQRLLFGGDDPSPTEKKTQDDQPTLPDAPDWGHSQKLATEKEVLGFYLTSHPLAQFADRIARHVTHTAMELAELNDGAEVLLGGMISSIKRTATKKPSRNGHSRYANFDFEDSSGIVRCIMWPEEYARFGEKIEAEAICFVKGKVERRGREPSLIVNQLLTIEEAEKTFTQQVAVKFQRGLHTEQDMLRTREVLQRHPGRTEVVVIVDTVDDQNAGGRLRYVMTTPSSLRVSCGPELQAELAHALGPAHFELHSAPKRKSGQANGSYTSRPATL